MFRALPFLLLLLFGCADAPRTEPAAPPLDESAIRHTFSTHDAAFMTGASDLLAERYTDDAVLVLPDGSTVEGASDVATWLMANWSEATLGIADVEFTATTTGADVRAVLRDGTPAHLTLVRAPDDSRTAALIERMELGTPGDS